MPSLRLQKIGNTKTDRQLEEHLQRVHIDRHLFKPFAPIIALKLCKCWWVHQLLWWRQRRKRVDQLFDNGEQLGRVKNMQSSNIWLRLNVNTKLCSNISEQFTVKNCFLGKISIFRDLFFICFFVLTSSHCAHFSGQNTIPKWTKMHGQAGQKH